MGRRPISIAEKKRRQKFGTLLQKQRHELSLGLREAARMAGLNHTTLSRIESGERPCSLGDLHVLGNTYGVPPEALQIALNGQISLALTLIRNPSEPLKSSADKTEIFSARTTPEEKRQLTLFLGYLRFAQGAEHPAKVIKS